MSYTFSHCDIIPDQPADVEPWDNINNTYKLVPQLMTHNKRRREFEYASDWYDKQNLEVLDEIEKLKSILSANPPPDNALCKDGKFFSAAYEYVIDKARNALSMYNVYDALYGTFGEERLLSEEKCVFTVDDVKKTYAILNKFFFANKLPNDIEICFATCDEVIRHAKSCNVNDFRCDERFFGLYFSAYDISEDDDVNMFGQKIFINSTWAKDRMFMNIICAIAHEMIHYWCETTGITQKHIISVHRLDIISDVHYIDEFIKCRRAMQDYDINPLVTDYIDSTSVMCNEKLEQTLQALIRRADYEYQSRLKFIKEGDKYYLDMKSVPNIITPTYMNYATGPHTRAIVFID